MEFTEKEEQNLSYFKYQAQEMGTRVKEQYSEDLIFIYPEFYDGQFETQDTFKKLQELFDLIKELTGINSTKKIPSEDNYARITIGYYCEPAKTVKKDEFQSKKLEGFLSKLIEKGYITDINNDHYRVQKYRLDDGFKECFPQDTDKFKQIESILQTNIAKWSGDEGNNSIYTPWQRLDDSKEPPDACTHEMVHPFFRCSSLHGTENEVWGEGFCDFLRGYLKKCFQDITKCNGIDWWQKQIDEANNAKTWDKNKCKWKNNSEGGAAAGQFLLEAKRIYYSNSNNDDEFLKDFINNKEKIKCFIKKLFTEYDKLPIHNRDNFFLTDKMMEELENIKKTYKIKTQYKDKRERWKV